ncbi:MAG: FtsX-like permease family protein [Luteolibacter sp.]|uniref:ABC transporter permease n=1 Tax=Luteolibacter sp. TaxID=1962973 RepID=UPI0032637DE4
MLSSFSLISLIGVMLGVLVLVVVMAVYAGLERNVKDRLLGYTPHVLMSNFSGPITDWEDAAKQAKALPHVEAAMPFVSGFVFLETQTKPHPISFRGIDTTDKEQVEGIRKMLDLKEYPTSSADLGIDDKVVMSSILAENLGIHVGDKVLLQSTSNFDGVRRAFKTASNPPLREAFADSWNKSTQTLKAGWKADGANFTLTADDYREVYPALEAFLAEDVREPELDLISSILLAMDESQPDKPGEEAKVFVFQADTKLKIEKAISDLNTTDVEKMDGATLKSFKTAVLPKEAVVTGIYQASQMTVTPDLFTPLPLAQDLAGLGQAVEGISLRLDDPYLANAFAESAGPTLGPDWSLVTWQQQYGAFFSLIEQQRGMMYFTLSFIMLISAFSMMAVMFTVTIQKRREIGVMKALGAAPNQIVRVFLYQGMILGTLGAILGVGLGRLVIHYVAEIQGVFRMLGFDPFTSTFTGFNSLPTHNDPVEQAGFAFMAFVLCSLSALVPAWFAARSDAAKSLRNL